MKKFTLIFCLLLGFGANAQNCLPKNGGTSRKADVQIPFLRTEMPRNNPSMNKGGTVSAWYNYTGALADSFTSLFKGKTYRQSIYTDTIVQVVSKNATTSQITSSYEFINSTGAFFDPVDTIFQYTHDQGRGGQGDSSVRPLTRKESYTIDSVYFPYSYVRNAETYGWDSTYKDSVLVGGVWKDTMKTVTKQRPIVDTLVVQISKPVTSNFYQWLGTPKQPFATFDFDVTTGRAKNMDQTVVITLTDKDTGKSFANGIKLPIGVNNGIVGCVFTYKSGRPVKLGDTLVVYGDPTIKPKKMLNPFYFILLTDASRHTLASYNNGLMIFNNQRYNPNWVSDKSGATPAKYFATNGSGSDFWYPEMLFKVSHDLIADAGIEGEKHNGVALGDVYPNPVVSGAANLQFSLDKPNAVSINVFDVLGRQVKNVVSGMYSSGSHNVSLNTSNFKPGVYFYSINANGFTQTKKFTVAQ